VWASYSQGATWTRTCASAPWAKTSTQQLVVTSDNMLVMFGNVPTVAVSADIGNTWAVCMTAAGWGIRWWPGLIIDANDMLILAGGNVEPSNPPSGWRNDIWTSNVPVSTSNLVQYCGLKPFLVSRATSNARWSPRGALYLGIAPNLTFVSTESASTVFWPTPTYLMTGRHGYDGNRNDWPSNDGQFSRMSIVALGEWRCIGADELTCLPACVCADSVGE
jgi:hypothetical protein